MAKRVSQLLAVMSGLQGETRQRLDQLLHVATTPDLFTGQVKTYRQPEGGTAALPADASKKVRTSADEVLNRAAEQLSKLWDNQLSIDSANQNAQGDIRVGSAAAPLVANVPVNHLGYLERELGTFERLVQALPVLDVAKEWTTTDMPAGQRRTPAVEDPYNNKVVYNWHRQNGTPQFQEQVDVMTRDERVGTSTTIYFTGAVEPARKQAILDRVARLRAEVKMAREEANAASVPEREEGAALFGWLLTGE